MVPPPSVTAPLLIADDPALDRYLLDIHGKNFASHVESGGVDLATWLASGEDADERSFQDAQRLGLPLLRLPDVAVDSATAALLPPQQARRLRVVPMRLHNGLLAVAMEDPTNAEALAGQRAVRDLIEQPAIVGAVQFTPAIQASERGPIDEDLGGGRKAKRYDWDYFVWFTPAA